VERNRAGQPVKQVNANGTWSELYYKNTGQLDNLRHRKSGGGVLASLFYQYDAAGRIRQESGPAGVRDFLFDELGQLIDERGADLGANGVQYFYDRPRIEVKLPPRPPARNRP
jgi:hypothetical protein